MDLCRGMFIIFRIHPSIRMVYLEPGARNRLESPIGLIELEMNFVLFFFFSISFYPNLKRHSYDDDHSLKNFSFNEIKLKKKQRSSLIYPSLVGSKMHQATTNESMIGVPSRLCSVCGDISTGSMQTKMK